MIILTPEQADIVKDVLDKAARDDMSVDEALDEYDIMAALASPTIVRVIETDVKAIAENRNITDLTDSDIQRVATSALNDFGTTEYYEFIGDKIEDCINGEL